MATHINIMQTQTLVKPAGVEFFNPTGDGRFENFVKSLTGFVSYSKSFPDANTKVQEITWDCKEDWVNYQDQAATNQMMIDNIAYNRANGITWSSVVTDIPVEI